MPGGIIVRWRRKLVWIPVALAVLFVIAFIVQMEPCTDTTRILVMCTDLRESPDQPQHYRSDLILIIEAREKDHKILITQVPRDTIAFICPQLGLDKVNCSVFLAGARGSRDVVGQLMGNKIQHYIVVRMPEFLQFAKIIGGITITTDSSGGSTGGDPKSAASGQNVRKPIVLRDKAALDYVMSRPGSDLERQKNQRSSCWPSPINAAS